MKQLIYWYYIGYIKILIVSALACSIIVAIVTVTPSTLLRTIVRLVNIHSLFCVLLEKTVLIEVFSFYFIYFHFFVLYVALFIIDGL